MNQFTFVQSFVVNRDAYLISSNQVVRCLSGFSISALASATIPHFWVVATMLLLALMAVITLRKLLNNRRVE